MSSPELEIVFEDNEILVCYKPAGIATQTKRLGQQDMESILKNYRAKKGEPPYIGVVHRLDQPVEGVMVFAKTPHAAAELSKQVQQRDFGKHYLAVAPAKKGEKSEDVLCDYLVADKKNNVTKVVAKGTARAQLAKLEYRMIGQMDLPDGEMEKEMALYDILLHTGRHHQIRVQFAHMGCPLWGDTKYGGQPEKQRNGSDTCSAVKKQLALCSYRVEFTHPTTGKEMDFSIRPKNEIFQSFPFNRASFSSSLISQ
jgi:23S rRNA pseudouridine1911/1915/1917 synthase